MLMRFQTLSVPLPMFVTVAVEMLSTENPTKKRSAEERE